MTSDTPQPELAVDIVRALVGVEPAGVRPFGSGTDHFVFEVTFAVRKPLVVRMTTPDRRDELDHSARLARRLRTLGVPLPSILAVERKSDFPYMVMQRLPGMELGMAMRGLSDDALAAIAEKVAAAQAVVAKTPTAGRYGFAASPEAAEHESWSAALNGFLDTLRWRMEQGGHYDPEVVDHLDWVALAAREELDAQPSTPFLAETTTQNVIVTLDGTFSGIVDVDELGFGDPRFVAARTEASILVGQKPNAYVDRWLAAAGQEPDRIFRLYIAIGLLEQLAFLPGGDSEAQAAARQRIRTLAEDHIHLLNVDWGMA